MLTFMIIFVRMFMIILQAGFYQQNVIQDRRAAMDHTPEGGPSCVDDTNGLAAILGIESAVMMRCTWCNMHGRLVIFVFNVLKWYS